MGINGCRHNQGFPKPAEKCLSFSVFRSTAGLTVDERTHRRDFWGVAGETEMRIPSRRSLGLIVFSKADRLDDSFPNCPGSGKCEVVT